MNPRVILAIARKDLVDAIRNMYILFSIVLPVGFSFLFSLMAGASGDVKLGSVAVFDEGHSRLVEQIKSDPSVEKLVETRSLEELREAVRKDAVGGLALPADFDAAVVAGRTPTLGVLINGRRGGGEQTAFRRLVDLHLRAVDDRPELAELVVSDVNEAPSGGSEAARTGRDVSGLMLITLLVMGLTMTGVFVVPTLLVEEKEKHTLRAILISPASYADVVIGKALVGLVYSLLIAAILLALNDGLRGNVALMAASVGLGGLLLVEIGLLMGALFSNSAQVNTWSTVAMLALIFPSLLAMSPIPEPGRTIMRVVPTSHLADLTAAARSGGSFGSSWTSLAVLGAFAVAFFIGVLWVLRRAER